MNLSRPLKVVFASTESTPRMIKFAECMGNKCNFHIFFSSRPIGRPAFWSRYRLNKCCSIEKKTFIIFGRSFNWAIFKKTVKRQPNYIILGGFFEITHLMLYLWAKYSGIKVVVFSESFWNPPLGRGRKFWQKKIIAQFFIKGIYGKVDGILGIGNGTKSFFTSYIGVESNKVYTTSYPVDIESHLNHPLRENNGGYVFLFPHRLIEWYNPIMCLKWFLEIQKIYPDVSLIFNGHGNLRQELELLIGEYKLTSKVSFTDSITSWDAMADVYKKSDILLSTKSVSGVSEWSVAEIEAMASGMGVIAFKNSIGLFEAISQNGSGFIIDKITDYQSVINAVSEYISTENLLKKHGQINRKIASQYSTESMSSEYLEILMGI